MQSERLTSLLQYHTNIEITRYCKWYFPNIYKKKTKNKIFTRKNEISKETNRKPLQNLLFQIKILSHQYTVQEKLVTSTTLSTVTGKHTPAMKS